MDAWQQYPDFGLDDIYFLENDDNYKFELYGGKGSFTEEVSKDSMNKWRKNMQNC